MAHVHFPRPLALTACLGATAVAAMAGAAGGVSVAAAAACPNANLTPQPGNIALVRAAVLCLIDQERESHGESTLQPNAKLTRAAEGHSRDMAAEDYFSHVAPDGETPLERMRASGYLSNPEDGYVVGENIAWGTLWLATPQAIVSAWMASPGHRANILDGAFRETGVGVSPRPPASLAEGQAGAIYTQDFGTVVPPGHSASRAPVSSASGWALAPRRAAGRRPGQITSAAQTSEQRSHTHHGSTRRQSRHRHRVRARHRARHRRAARRTRRARAHQRSRRRRR